MASSSAPRPRPATTSGETRSSCMRPATSGSATSSPCAGSTTSGSRRASRSTWPIRPSPSSSPRPNPGSTSTKTLSPLAYGIDETQGTTPIYQNILNLKDAKSAYGAIVYQKAPAVLKQLNFFLGEDTFRNGLQALPEAARVCECSMGRPGRSLRASGQSIRPVTKMSRPGPRLGSSNAACRR